MENSKLNISERKKILYKRKRIRQLTFRLICLFTLSLLAYFPVKYIYNKKIESTKQPTINKLLTTSKGKKTVICIDPGHGDWDTGTKGYKGSLEKDIVLSIGLKLGKLLEENENIQVVYTRTNDTINYLDDSNDSLKERIKISEVFKSDIFISLHCNSDYNSNLSRGLETWYNPDKKESFELATTIQDSLKELNYTENRGIKTYENKEDALAVVELNTANSVLLELGFLSNFLDEKYLLSENGQNNIAKSLNDTLISYINTQNKD